MSESIPAGRIRDPRITEQRNPRTAGIDLAAPLEIVDLMNAEDRTLADAVATQRGKRWSITLAALEYDWAEVATQATRNGRPDFAQAFIER